MEDIYSISNLGNLRNGFGKLAFWGKNGTEIEAYELAEADMSRRAAGHTPIIKNNCIEKLQVIFKTFDTEYLPTIKKEVCPEKRQEKFDEWHRNSCSCLRDTMNSGSFKGTYGRAQKVINMAFKYMYCCENTREKYQEIFPYCHMPLDRYTLEWFRREVKCVIEIDNNHTKKIDDNYAWSKIDDYDKEYIKIQKAIRKHLEESKEKISPIEKESIEWPKIQAQLATEAFLPKLMEALYYSGDLSIDKYKEYLTKKEDNKEKTLDYIIEQVSKALTKLGY